jgi:hypothetical protein
MTLAEINRSDDARCLPIIDGGPYDAGELKGLFEQLTLKHLAGSWVSASHRLVVA